jgi:tetratricopeptide (TPR) repeat protein
LPKPGKRGNALDELKRHDEALVAYDKALGLYPHFPAAWHGRGNALSALKRCDEALAAYERALALAPDLWRSDSHTILGSSPQSLRNWRRTAIPTPCSIPRGSPGTSSQLTPRCGDVSER